MKISDMTRQQKTEFLGTVMRAVQDAIGHENLFVLLVVDDKGGVTDLKNIQRSELPRLLRTYADVLERKTNGHP